MIKILKNKLLAVVAISILSSTSGFAFTPTADQIAQFQRLPKAQQEQLARQYGVDISVITGASASNAQSQVSQVAQPIRTTAVQTKSSQVTSAAAADRLEPFGYDVLSGTPLDYTPVDDLPVPNDYVMAPGDEVQIQLYGTVTQKMSLIIDREGNINFAKYGPVAVAGETFGKMREHISSFVKQKAIGANVVVSMGTLRTMQVFIVGEVEQPGAYNVNGLTSIMQALVASGGIKHNGSLRKVQLKRKGKVVSTLDLYDLLIYGDSSGDVRLLAGDTLFVPTKKSNVTIQGQILRPAIYELKGKTTLGRLLATAGGATPNAYLSKVSVRRPTLVGVEQFTLNLAESKDKRFVVKSGDSVTIAKSSTNLKNAIAVRGEVIRQGALNFTDGMRVNDVITSIQDDLKPNADLNFALIVREKNQLREISVLQFNLGNAISNPGSADNILLNESDQLFVFDNGVELNYWYNQQVNRKAQAKSSPKERSSESLDNETGAIIFNDDVTKLRVQSEDAVSKAEYVQQSSREQLLTPIIERLKAQSNFEHPAQLVTITGAVKFPGTYPFAVNQNIKQLIQAAGGLTERAYIKRAVVTRNIGSNDNYTNKHYPFSLERAMNGEDGLMDLQAQDSVMIKTQPNWQRDMIIELQGEVMFPGTYTFERGETLEDIIERAGGLTQFAYAEGSVFSRERLKRQEQERLRLLNVQLKQEIAGLALRRQSSSASYTSSPSEAMQVADELSNTQAMGRLVIDLVDAIKGDSSANIMLEKGDKLYVPAVNPTISIMGEVQFASNHTFRPEMSVEQYLTAAGGTKKQADTDRIYIVRADGSVMLPNNSYWFSRKEKPLQPGDTIIVPIDTDYLDGLSTLTSATQILYQIGVAWSAVKN